LFSPANKKKRTNSITSIDYCQLNVALFLAVECDEFPMVFNATANAKKSRFKDKVVWQCNDGFMFPDGKVKKSVECKANYVNLLIGRWSEEKLPDCESKHTVQAFSCGFPPTMGLVCVSRTPGHHSNVQLVDSTPYSCYYRTLNRQFQCLKT
jgi:hypothetical protein